MAFERTTFLGCSEMPKQQTEALQINEFQEDTRRKLRAFVDQRGREAVFETVAYHYGSMDPSKAQEVGIKVTIGDYETWIHPDGADVSRGAHKRFEIYDYDSLDDLQRAYLKFVGELLGTDASHKLIASLETMQYARVRTVETGKIFHVSDARAFWNRRKSSHEKEKLLRRLNEVWPNPSLILATGDDDLERELIALPGVEKHGDGLILSKEAFANVVPELYCGNWIMIFFPEGRVPEDFPEVLRPENKDGVHLLLQRTGAAAAVVSGPDDLDWDLFLRQDA